MQISSYRGNKPTSKQTNKQTDRCDYNTLRRSLARNVIIRRAMASAPIVFTERRGNPVTPQRDASDLGKVLEEGDGHVEKSAVLGDAGLEARVHAHQLADDLLALSLGVALERQHLGRLEQRLHLLLRLLTDRYTHTHTCMHAFGSCAMTWSGTPSLLRSSEPENDYYYRW